MSERHYLIGADEAASASHRLQRAAEEANKAASRLEDAIHQLRQLTENGYGNNVSLLIELLQKQQEATS